MTKLDNYERNSMLVSYENEGLNITDIAIFFQLLKASQIGRILNTDMAR